jgi:hypothetical protein
MAEESGSFAAVLGVISAQQRDLWERTSKEIGELEARRDRENARLQRAAAVLEQSSSRPKLAEAKSSHRRHRPKQGTAQAARKRQDVVYRFLSEKGEPLAKGAIRDALRLTDSEATTALTRLLEQRRIKRVGTGSATRYMPRSSSAANGSSTMQEPTLEGLIVATVEDRASASLDELAQTTKAPQDDVKRICGGLVRDEELRMSSRNGRPVYVLPPAA